MAKRLLAALVSTAFAVAPAGNAQFEISGRDVLIDERVPITVSGLTPHATITITAHGGEDEGWTSSAEFVADASGIVDLTKALPVRGSYKEVDAMGLFWSVERGRASKPAAAVDQDDELEERTPETWTLTAEVNHQLVARTTIRRRPVAAAVRVRPLRTDGL